MQELEGIPVPTHSSHQQIGPAGHPPGSHRISLAEQAALVTCGLVLAATACALHTARVPPPSGTANFQRIVQLILENSTPAPPLPAAVARREDFTEADQRQVLELLIRDALLNQDSRDSYGGTGIRRAAIIADSEVKLPSAFVPRIEGWDLKMVPNVEAIDPNGPRHLVVRIARLTPWLESNFFEGNAMVILSGDGREEDGVVKGGGILLFSYCDRDANGWRVLCTFAKDP